MEAGGEPAHTSKLTSESARSIGAGSRLPLAGSVAGLSPTDPDLFRLSLAWARTVPMLLKRSFERRQLRACWLLRLSLNLRSRRGGRSSPPWRAYSSCKSCGSSSSSCPGATGVVTLTRGGQSFGNAPPILAKRALASFEVEATLVRAKRWSHRQGSCPPHAVDDAEPLVLQRFLDGEADRDSAVRNALPAIRC